MPQLATDLIEIENQRLAVTTPSAIRKFDQEISDIPEIIKLTLGEPDLNTPEHVKQAAIHSIENNESHYGRQAGNLQLCKAISAYLKRKQELVYNPNSEIIITVGATEAIATAIISLFNPGDEVIVPTPIFALYFSLLQLFGITAVTINTADDDYLLTPEALKRTLKRHPQAKGIILNYPNNPTGREYPPKLIKQLGSLLASQQLYVISDEIYSELLYKAQKHYSIARVIPERTILINGLSKSHAMTGYRIGYLAGPQAIIKKMTTTHALLVTTVANTTQAAATEALSPAGDLDPQAAVKIYTERQQVLSDGLTKLGLKVIPPEGAFYLFVKIPEKYQTDDKYFAKLLATKARVGCIPGSAFGPGGEGHIRFSYAASLTDIEKAINRIAQFLNNGGTKHERL
ncbi:aminotransferase class I/II-fold pyridoxal phosphate-dependent enzyme [Lactobacillus sp. ESL0681]|uniref:aminotransferase class I/II-fold pyridoxal phosphate-dependent enzyme n=1 Tax=Lactobacillus sp. ESL0681 TaxID=2983211 RepID=UPI0023F6436C|nr:aminotransferase class I/II-fold pyridoxal phosphate-dependent enzyme [Lactobacillus sp. ESL0681]WEV39617.1 aminotransferase class I/II-fold pyridoxal phosphate-dependent enzyme [Lactobacillus sp. ESL0681]